MALADSSVEITGLDSSNSGLGEATGLDGWGLGESTGLDAATGVLAKSRRGGSRALDEVTAVAGREQGSWRSHGIGSRAHHEATVRRGSMNSGALNTLHLVFLHREMFVLCFYTNW
jgi:hypothetical protein